MSDWKRKLLRSVKYLAFAAVVACGGNAYAATFNFDGGAVLDINDLATQFSLSTTTFPSTWGANAFIGGIAVDATGTPSVGTVSGGGVSSVSTSPGGGPGGGFDFRFNLGGPGSSDRFVGSETVDWQASGISNVTNVALHVQGLDTNNFPGGSMWLTAGGNGGTPPIPEPSTYAMFILGLLAMGFLARKRMTQGGFAV